MNPWRSKSGGFSLALLGTGSPPGAEIGALGVAGLTSTGDDLAPWMTYSLYLMSVSLMIDGSNAFSSCYRLTAAHEYTSSWVRMKYSVVPGLTPEK